MGAVIARMTGAHTHYKDYEHLIQTSITKPVEIGTDIEKLIFGLLPDNTIGIGGQFFVTSEAYAFACLQAMHAIADHLAYVVRTWL